MEIAPTLDALSSAARSLLDSAGRVSLFTSRPWFETFVAAGLAPGASPLFHTLLASDGTPLAMAPMQRLGSDRGVGNPAIASLTSFYSCDFQPLIATDAEAPATTFALGRGLAHALGHEPVVRFDSLDATLPTLQPFLAGLARPGRALLRYEHFGRWSENLEGLTFDDYLGRRSGALREVVRRKGKRLAQEGGSFEMVDPADAERGIAAYESVYARSWKEPEPFPAFQPMLMRKLAAAGWLRLVLCHHEHGVVAAALWVVVGGRATVLKLAHDSAFDRLSPGTLLTAFAIRTLMERDRITSLDFGRGDDSYKATWTTRRTPHIGVLWTSVARRPVTVARHKLGALLRGRGSGATESKEADDARP